MEDANKNKYDLLMHLLSEGDAMVCLDARSPGVDVPPQHKNNPTLNLVFNLNFRRPIEVAKEGVFTTLSFQGRPYKCVVPFESVWAIYDPNTQKGQVWEESIPKDLDLSGMIPRSASEKTSPPKIVARKPAAKPGTNNDGAPPNPKRDRSHLRVIK